MERASSDLNDEMALSLVAVPAIPYASGCCLKQWLTNPFGLQQVSCVKSAHKHSNCATNPRCLINLAERKGIWAKQASDAVERKAGYRNPSIHHIGINNMGATCYAATIMHLLYTCRPLRHFMYQWLANQPDADAASEPTKDVSALAEIFARIDLSVQSSLSIESLVRRFSLDPTYQQDAHEFLKMLLQMLEKIFTPNRFFPRNIITDTFQGTMAYVTRCKSCGSSSRRVVPFLGLETPLKVMSTPIKCVSHSLAQMFAQELLDGDNQYACGKCAMKCDAVRYAEVETWPDTLHVQLMRFVYDVSFGGKKKLKHVCHIPDILEVKSVDGSSIFYELVGFISHIGDSASQGHYIVDVWSDEKRSWYHVDDNVVTAGKADVPHGESSQQNSKSPSISAKRQRPAHVKAGLSVSPAGKKARLSKSNGSAATQLLPSSSTAASVELVDISDWAVTGYYIDEPSHPRSGLPKLANRSDCHPYIIAYDKMEKTRVEAWCRTRGELVEQERDAIHSVVSCKRFPPDVMLPHAVACPPAIRKVVEEENSALQTQLQAADVAASAISRSAGLRRECVERLVSQSHATPIRTVIALPSVELPSPLEVLQAADSSVGSDVVAHPVGLDFVTVRTSALRAWVMGEDILKPSSAEEHAPPSSTPFLFDDGDVPVGLSDRPLSPFCPDEYKVLPVAALQVLRDEGSEAARAVLASAKALLSTLGNSYTRAAGVARMFCRCNALHHLLDGRWPTSDWVPPTVEPKVGAPSSYFISKAWLAETKKRVGMCNSASLALAAGKKLPSGRLQMPDSDGATSEILCSHSTDAVPLMHPNKSLRRRVSAEIMDVLMKGLPPSSAGIPLLLAADGDSPALTCPQCADDTTREKKQDAATRLAKKACMVPALRSFWSATRAIMAAPRPSDYTHTGPLGPGKYYIIPHAPFQMWRDALNSSHELPEVERCTRDFVQTCVCQQSGSSRLSIPSQLLRFLYMSGYRLQLACANEATGTRNLTSSELDMLEIAGHNIFKTALEHSGTGVLSDIEHTLQDAGRSVEAHACIELCTPAELTALQAHFACLQELQFPSITISEGSDVTCGFPPSSNGDLSDPDSAHNALRSMEKSIGARIYGYGMLTTPAGVQVAFTTEPSMCIPCMVNCLVHTSADTNYFLTLIPHSARASVSSRRASRSAKRVEVCVSADSTVKELALAALEAIETMPTALFWQDRPMPSRVSLRDLGVRSGDVIAWTTDLDAPGQLDWDVSEAVDWERGFKGSRFDG